MHFLIQLLVLGLTRLANEQLATHVRSGRHRPSQKPFRSNDIRSLVSQWLLCSDEIYIYLFISLGGSTIQEVIYQEIYVGLTYWL